jgi:hypothetical protein
VDRLSTIEKAVVDALKTIQGQTIASGYKYYSSTGSADIEDNALAMSNNATKTKVNHLLIATDDGEENAEWDVSQNVYTNVSLYEIHSQIFASSTPTVPARTELKNKSNEVYSDLKALFGNNHTLSQAVNWIKVTGGRCEYANTGDRITGAKQITKIEIEYSQLLLNPDISTC